MVFDGCVLSNEEFSAVRRPEKELREVRVLPPEEALALLTRRLARRVRRCLAARDAGATLYLEEQKSPWLG